MFKSNVVKLNDRKYHKGSSDELLGVCKEGKWIENKIISL